MISKRDKDILDDLNYKAKNELLLVMVISGTAGLIIGIVLASWLHKYIVHPLGY